MRWLLPYACLLASGAGVAQAQQSGDAGPTFGERPQGAPVLVVPVGCPSCDSELVTALMTATVAAVDPMLTDRPVLPGTAQADRARECAEPTCIGALVAEAGAIAGVVIRLTRNRRRDPVTIQLEVVDPVSGSARGTSAEATVTPESLEPVATLAGEIRGLLPAAPARSTLLMAVNVDGAAISINDHPVGQSPLAPVDLPPGRYTVRATLDGYGDAQTQITVARGEGARVNLDLTKGGVAGNTYADANGPAEEDETPIYARWYVLTGAGAVVVGAAVVIAVVASSSSGQDVQAIAVPPIE